MRTRVHFVVRRIVVGLIRFYQAAISPLTPPACRFVPSCSEYAATAVGRFGVLRGGWMAVKRFLRCHPLGGRGPDPVPTRPEAEDLDAARGTTPRRPGDGEPTGGGADPAREDPGGGPGGP